MLETHGGAYSFGRLDTGTRDKVINYYRVDKKCRWGPMIGQRGVGGYRPPNRFVSGCHSQISMWVIDLRAICDFSARRRFCLDSGPVVTTIFHSLFPFRSYPISIGDSDGPFQISRRIFVTLRSFARIAIGNVLILISFHFLIQFVSSILIHNR